MRRGDLGVVDATMASTTGLRFGSLVALDDGPVYVVTRVWGMSVKLEPCPNKTWQLKLLRLVRWPGHKVYTYRMRMVAYRREVRRRWDVLLDIVLDREGGE